MKDIIDVAICLDENVIVPAAVLISSIARNADFARGVRIHALTAFDADRLREVVEPLPLHVELVVYEAGHCFAHLPDKDYISKATYLRFLLPTLLSTAKVLYLDIDIIVQRDLGELFAIDVSGVSLAAVSDLSLQTGSLFWDDFHVVYRERRYAFADYAGRVLGLDRSGTQYFNAGVLLINLDYWRQEKVAEQALRFLTDHLTLEYLDQDALSAVTGGQYVRLDPRWNAMANCVGAPDRRIAVQFSKKGREWERIRKLWKEEPWIVHYAGPYKPWLSTGSVAHADIWWRYAMNSNVRGELESRFQTYERSRMAALSG